MIGTFIYNSSGPNNPSNAKHRISSNNSKKQINNSENYDQIQSREMLQQINRKKEINLVKKPKIIPNTPSSCSLENDISDFSQYASRASNPDSSINSCLIQSSSKNVCYDNSSILDSNASIESICIENAKLKTKLEVMDEKEIDMKSLAEENEKLRRAYIKLNLEFEKLKASSPVTPQYQNYTFSHQIQQLKDEIKNKTKLISQLGKQQEVLSNENEKLRAKVLKQNELFNKLTISSKDLIAENERLQALFQDQKRKLLQKKEEKRTLMYKIEKNEPVIDHQVIQSLNDQVANLEKSYCEIQTKNDKLLKENTQLKEQISLYQQIDTKMQTENKQLKEVIVQLSNSTTFPISTDKVEFDKSKYVPKSVFEELNSSFLELQHQMENTTNNLKQNISLKETQCMELIKEKDKLSTQLKEKENQIIEIKEMKENIENQYKIAKNEINQLTQTIVPNEQISYENSQLREKNISLSKKLEEFSSLEKLELENNTLKQENARLKEALDQASQISEIKDLVYENGYGYEKDNSILSSENEELKNELEDAKNRLNSIMNVLKKCSMENIIPEM